MGGAAGGGNNPKPIRLKIESLLLLNDVLNTSRYRLSAPFGCLQRSSAAVANSRVKALKLWKLSSQALVSILIGLILARLLKDVSKPKIQHSSGASKTLGPSSEGDFDVRPSAKVRISAYIQNYICDINSYLPGRV